MSWIDAILQGTLLGGQYALFAAGLSLIFGVMRLVNIAHGDLIVLSAFIALVCVESLNLHPLLSIFIVCPIMFCFGYALQKVILNQFLGKDILPVILVTFGISIIIQNVLFEIFSADSQRLLSGELDTLSLKLSDTLSIGWLPLIAFLASIAVITSLQFFFYKTKTGMVFRATSDNSEVVELMGVNRNHVFALAMGVALAVAALAAIFMGMRTNFDPSVGPARLIYAFEAVIIGGLGSLWGTLAGGIIIGVSQAIGANINPGWQVLSGHLVFLFILAIKPNGLFPKTKD